MGQSGHPPPPPAARRTGASRPARNRHLPPPERLVEQVIVSASRISIGGYQQPTPVTVIGADQLRRDAYTDIGDAIRQLPAFGASSSPNNTVARQLHRQRHAGHRRRQSAQSRRLRTLVLFDGQRVVASALSGGVDLSTMPTSLVAARGCGDRRRLGGLGFGRGRRRGQRHPQPEFRRARGQHRRRRFLERRSPFLEGRACPMAPISTAIAAI